MVKTIKDSIDKIEIATESESITEKFEVTSILKGCDFNWTAKLKTVAIDDYLWAADLDELISSCNENDIDGLNSNNFNISVTGHTGGSYEDMNVKWETPLTNDLLEEIEEKGGIEFLFFEGDLSSDYSFENG
jgi:hypothetical protein